MLSVVADGVDDACNPDRLIELVRRGGSDALDRVTRCYGERLLAAGRRRCRSADEAGDAVQDALLSAATNLDAFRGEGSLDEDFTAPEIAAEVGLSPGAVRTRLTRLRERVRAALAPML